MKRGAAPAASSWRMLKPQTTTALAHPDGIVGLAVGAPVDEVPAVIREALFTGGGFPGYPVTAGTEELRAGIVRSLARRYGITVPADATVLPTVGSKEIIAALPGLLEARTVVIPELAYPTYEAGAWLAGAQVRRSGAGDLIWVNSPSNPSGRVHPVGELRELVALARASGAVLASDECYLAFGWDEEPRSVLHPDVCDGDFTGLLAVHSLSKTANLAGYRAGFVAGDPVLVNRLVELRKQGGLTVPHPVQQAMVAASSDDTHIESQRERYRARRARLWPALEAAGFRIDESGAGIYLWATAGEDAWRSVTRLAEHGILVSPGTFYGPAGKQHIRVALTATDERIDAAVGRLHAM
jgi:succinyldiaminopimelate transaminase